MIDWKLSVSHPRSSWAACHLNLDFTSFATTKTGIANSPVWFPRHFLNSSNENLSLHQSSLVNFSCSDSSSLFFCHFVKNDRYLHEVVSNTKHSVSLHHISKYRERAYNNINRN